MSLARATPARAQACCAGASTLTPTRLTSSEWFAAGLRLRASSIAGSLDATGAWTGSAATTTDSDFGEDLFAMTKVVERLQLGLVVPVNEAWRTAGTLTDLGGGVGDLQLSMRWDLATAEESDVWPGVALLAGVSAPTGTPVERARQPLATDATGLGSATGMLGVQLEKAAGHVLLDALATVTGQWSREADGVTQGYAPDWNVALAAGWAFDSGPGVALVGTFRHRGEATVDGAPSPGSALSLATIGLAGGAYVSDHWRVQGSVTMPLPFWGENTPVAPGLAVSIIRAWM